MKSIKPGRGPSMMGAVGSIAAVVFGVIWTAAAASMGAPFFFPLFGVVFIVLGIVQAVYNFKNATGKNRYSAFDITDSSEEPDPLNQRFSPREQNVDPEGLPAGGRFCPFCGAPTEQNHEFCRSCGKKL